MIQVTDITFVTYAIDMANLSEILDKIEKRALEQGIKFNMPRPRPRKRATTAINSAYDYGVKAAQCGDCEDGDDAVDFHQGIIQWTSNNGKTFVPASTTVTFLPPGAYEIRHSQQVGPYFEWVDVKTEGLVHFPDTNSDKVITEIQKFWDREQMFRDFEILYKRGILIYGPAGSGKSSTIQFVMRDVIARKGVVVKFQSPDLFIMGMRILREIQPDTPIVVLMEDLDSILENYSESTVLNLLDGIDLVDKIVFLATTNYPEQLRERIINRPSRFDKRFFIGYPTEDSRRIYFRHLANKGMPAEIAGAELSPENDAKYEAWIDNRLVELGIDIDQWVADTHEFSIAHLKELFIAVVIQGDTYQEAIKTLHEMRNEVRGDRDSSDYGGFGFERRPPMGSKPRFRSNDSSGDDCSTSDFRKLSDGFRSK